MAQRRWVGDGEGDHVHQHNHDHDPNHDNIIVFFIAMIAIADRPPPSILLPLSGTRKP